MKTAVRMKENERECIDNISQVLDKDETQTERNKTYKTQNEQNKT